MFFIFQLLLDSYMAKELKLYKSCRRTSSLYPPPLVFLSSTKRSYLLWSQRWWMMQERAGTQAGVEPLCGYHLRDMSSVCVAQFVQWYCWSITVFSQLPLFVRDISTTFISVPPEEPEFPRFLGHSQVHICIPIMYSHVQADWTWLTHIWHFSTWSIEVIDVNFFWRGQWSSDWFGEWKQLGAEVRVLRLFK